MSTIDKALAKQKAKQQLEKKIQDSEFPTA